MTSEDERRQLLVEWEAAAGSRRDGRIYELFEQQVGQRPEANIQAYVLDARMQPVPAGVVGELYLGGEDVGRACSNDPAQTAEMFVPDALKQHHGGRLYRTGDLVRYRSNGSLEFVARVDDRKVGGAHHGADKLETVLASFEDVRKVRVMEREDAHGKMRFVAYVVPRTGVQVEPDDIYGRLGKMLPEYMLPSAIIALDETSLLTDGEIDRRALPEVAAARRRAGASARPRTATEKTVAGVWAEVLGVGVGNADDNFFNLGGHSHLAVQVMSRVRKAFGVELPLRVLFESPTVAELASRIEAVTKTDPVRSKHIVRRAADTKIPLSFAQQRMWFLDQFEDMGATYHIPIVMRLSGELDVAALEYALTEIIRRHEVLRTTFVAADGTPVQVIGEARPFRISVTDLRHLPPAARESETARLTAEEIERRFELASGPLVRASLLRLGAEESVLTFVMHHIVSDGWSMGVLVKEVGALYAAQAHSRPSPLAEPTIQYADFAIWERDSLTGHVLDAQLAYWREQLRDAPPVLELPADHPRPLAPTFRGGSSSFNLSAPLTEELKTFSLAHGATLYMTLLAGFKSLLMRYTGQKDIVVGTPVANRNRAETEGLIGFFVNTLAMRTDVSGDPTFSELLDRVREVALGAFAHQEVPFEKLVEELQPKRQTGHTPIFQVMFTLQNTPAGAPQLPGVRMEAVPFATRSAKFDLTFELRAAGAQLAGEVEYSAELFEPETAAQLARDYVRLLEQVVRRPESKLSEVELVGDDDRRWMLEELNATTMAYPSEQSIHHLFEEQAARTPEAVALRCGAREVTYRELNARANQLAHYLRDAGVRAEARVGICVERDIEMVVGLLGILKAGGAYVPLDPQYPRERLQFMLDDSSATLLLTQSRLVEKLPVSVRAKVVALDGAWEEIARHSEENPPRLTLPRNIAYLIYTSGSTGRPKGVAIEHGNAVAFIHWARRAFDDSELAGVLASTSISFDLSVFEIFVPLSWGGSAIVAANALELPTLDARDEVTLVNTVPSAMAELINMDGVPTSVRTVNLAGEPLSGALVRRLYERERIGRVLNLYGPTEDTTYSTWGVMPKNDSRTPTIGRPVANTEVYLLDERQRPVPLGVAGEVYIGGAGLARGYHDRADLTAARFVPHPFSKERGARLYRTGDLARYRRDGEIEFLGRLDYQVKVRGYRIELGEVEARLAEQEHVRECVVVAREDVPSDVRLVAYVVSDEHSPASIDVWRRALKEKLPEYMIPSAFVLLDELPRTPNGKIDRRALPAPDLSGAACATEYVAPRTGVEELMAGVWSEVLGVTQLSIEADFFDVGGHSLLATRLVSRIREAFGVEVALRRLFESPTVRGLAAIVEEAMNDGQAVRIVPPIQRASREEPLLLSFAQQRLWFSQSA